MRNPWLDLPDEQELVLPIDRPYVEVHNRIFDETRPHHLRLTSPPSPFAGRFDAPFVVLLANPGHAEEDASEQNEPSNRKVILDNLRTENGAPFWPLTPQFAETSAGRWWRSRTRELAETVAYGDVETGYRVLSERLLEIELHGYHSTSWFAPRAQFPSQAFNVQLVRRAMRNGAVILAARAVDCWYAAVPSDGDSMALMDYPELIEGTQSKQSAYISRGNLAEGTFDQIVAALRS